MTRGKYANRARNRYVEELEARVATLTAQVAALEAEAREREQAHKDEVTAAVNEAATHTVEYVQGLLTKKAETLAQGMSAATWKAQRLAMTEHLTWLFFKGYIQWDRMEGDRQVLLFLATHGDLDAWWRLTAKYGHNWNHKTRRKEARHDPVARMLTVLNQIHRSGKSDAERIKADRAALDGVVDVARDGFINVELQEVLTDQGLVLAEPSEEELAMHAEVMAAIPAYLERAQ